MRPKRHAEDLPRLVAALGLDGPDGFDARAVDRAALTTREQDGLDHWVPTRESLARVVDPPRGRTSPAEHAPDAGVPSGRHRRPTPAVSVVDVPAGLRGARHLVHVRVVAVALVVVLIAVALFAARVVRARAAATPRPVGTSGVSGAVGLGASPAASSSPVVSPSSGVVARTTTAFGAVDATAASAGPSQAAAGPAGGTVMVHVVGQVRRPGVVRLAEGSRVADAVRAAGGSTARADLASVNLARVIVDGEQIRVPKPGETASPAPSSAAGGNAGALPPAGTSAGQVNLNTADLAALDTLPGVGPVLAQRILDWRAEHGRFTSVDELAEVSGIGEKMLAQLTSKVTV